MADIRKRQAIHERKVKCSKCNNVFKITPNEPEQKLVEEKGEKIAKDRDEKLQEESAIPNLYPNLEEEEPFLCQDCKVVSNLRFVNTFESNSVLCIWNSVAEKIYNKYLILFVICFGIIFLQYATYFWLNSSISPTAKSFDVVNRPQSHKEVELDKACLKLERNHFQHQNEEIWPVLLSGIKAITKSKPHQPAVFLMLYDDKSASSTAYCLAKMLSNLATQYMNIGVRQPVELTGKYLDDHHFISDSGRVLEKYKDSIRRNGAMILTDLQDVPAEVARSFHFMCDKFTPLVETAVYFFTLRVDSAPQNYREWSKTAQKTLKELWGQSLNDDLLSPLLTRMTQESIAIFPGDYVKC